MSIKNYSGLTNESQIMKPSDFIISEIQLQSHSESSSYIRKMLYNTSTQKEDKTFEYKQNVMGGVIKLSEDGFFSARRRPRQRKRIIGGNTTFHQCKNGLLSSLYGVSTPLPGSNLPRKTQDSKLRTTDANCFSASRLLVETRNGKMTIGSSKVWKVTSNKRVKKNGNTINQNM